MPHAFEVISLDLFQTLVDNDSRIEYVWRPILGDVYTPESAAECARLLLDRFFVHWRVMRDEGHFCLLREVYRNSFGDVLERRGLAFDQEEACRILFQEHTYSALYDDTLEFLIAISDIYKTCIVSDADEDMVPGFYEDYGITLFTSENYQSYKNDEHNKMFKELLRFNDVDPSKVLHIGDSVNDVLGAKREGIKACWLNRRGLNWEWDVAPDYEVRSLLELNPILMKG